jgi:hypothetical protein
MDSMLRRFGLLIPPPILNPVDRPWGGYGEMPHWCHIFAISEVQDTPAALGLTSLGRLSRPESVAQPFKKTWHPADMAASASLPHLF